MKNTLLNKKRCFVNTVDRTKKEHDEYIFISFLNILQANLWGGSFHPITSH